MIRFFLRALVLLALTGLNACALASLEPDASFASAFEGFRESIEDRLTNCFDAQTLPDMNQCRNEGERRAETYMREAEASLKTNFKVGEPKLLPLFERAQRAWLEQAKAECEYETYYSLGTEAYDAEMSLCRERQYLSRLAYLRSQLDAP